MKQKHVYLIYSLEFDQFSFSMRHSLFSRFAFSSRRSAVRYLLRLEKQYPSACLRVESLPIYTDVKLPL